MSGEFSRDVNRILGGIPGLSVSAQTARGLTSLLGEASSSSDAVDAAHLGMIALPLILQPRRGWGGALALTGLAVFGLWALGAIASNRPGQAGTPSAYLL